MVEPPRRRPARNRHTSGEGFNPERTTTVTEPEPAFPDTPEVTEGDAETVHPRNIFADLLESTKRLPAMAASVEPWITMIDPKTPFASACEHLHAALMAVAATAGRIEWNDPDAPDSPQTVTPSKEALASIRNWKPKTWVDYLDPVEEDTLPFDDTAHRADFGIHLLWHFVTTSEPDEWDTRTLLWAVYSVIGSMPDILEYLAPAVEHDWPGTPIAQVAPLINEARGHLAATAGIADHVPPHETTASAPLLWTPRLPPAPAPHHFHQSTAPPCEGAVSAEQSRLDTDPDADSNTHD